MGVIENVDHESSEIYQKIPKNETLTQNSLVCSGCEKCAYKVPDKFKVYINNYILSIGKDDKSILKCLSRLTFLMNKTPQTKISQRVFLCIQMFEYIRLEHVLKFTMKYEKYRVVVCEKIHEFRNDKHIMGEEQFKNVTDYLLKVLEK